MSRTPTTTQSPAEELQLTPLELQSPTSVTANEDQTKEIAPFLRSLRRMLDRESDAILCWTADGKAFEIHDMDVMTNYILPKYFKHSKYTSFQRQLNYFNFRKWTKSRAVVCTFSNAFFVRDQPDLTWRITRKRGLSDAKSPGDGGAASDGGEAASPRTPKPSPKASPKPRASATATAAATASTSAATTKPTTLKREQSASSSSSSKRKASSSSASSKKAKLSSSTASVVKIDATATSAAVSPTDPAESLEWVDTLYPSLEALEAECSVGSNSTSVQFSNYALQSDPQMAFAWPQYLPASASTSSAGPLGAEPLDRFRAQLSSYEAYFVPTVVQTRCVAL